MERNLPKEPPKNSELILYQTEDERTRLDVRLEGRLPAFDRYIGIDYSGAETPLSSLKGLRVYRADRESSPQEVQPPPSPRKYWTRRGLAEWLRRADLNGPLADYFKPDLIPPERQVAQIEGWILGIK